MINSYLFYDIDISTVIIIIRGLLFIAMNAAADTSAPALDRSTSSVRASVLQKFTFLAAKMTNTHVSNTQGSSPQEQLDKYMMEVQSYGGTSGKQFWMDRQAVYHSLAPLALDLSAPASEAYVERKTILSLRGMLTAGRRNRLKKNFEMRVFLAEQ